MPERRHPVHYITSGDVFRDLRNIGSLDPGRWIDKSTLIAIKKALESKVDKNSPNGAEQLD